jgi:hypothetical protein
VLDETLLIQIHNFLGHLMSFRTEKKYRVTLTEYHQLKSLLSKRGMARLYHARRVNSIYFDTEDCKMFHQSEEGLLPRKKIRIRWYDNENLFTLETKISSTEGRFKKAKRLTSVENIDDALLYQPIDGQYGIMSRCLHISYQRAYFVINGMRITFDEAIEYRSLRQNKLLVFKDPERVIEIKVPFGISEDFIATVVPYPTARFSKYSRGLLMAHGKLALI